MTPSTPLSRRDATYPADLQERDQWLTWKATDGRKIPRAPYEHPDQPDRFVDAQAPEVWTSFETAREWASKLGGFELAYVIRNREDYPDEDLAFVDYDDVRDPESGAIHPTVREHIEAADSYADVSTSGTGVHILCRGSLPESVQTITDDLAPAAGFADAEVEVYDSARFVAMTGQHLEGTPTETRTCQSFIDDLAVEYATVTASRPDAMRSAPATSKAELADLETTTDIQDVYDAIAQTRPADIRLRSTVTEERADGSKSLDPAWTHSSSGTRLAEVDERWIYRDGMIGLDALQVVALEEGIITDEREYPSGEAFHEAVDALRDRGAHIPEFDPDQAASDRDSGGAGASVFDTPDEPKASTSDPALAHEVEMLRETVTEQRARIEDLEAALDERETTIEDLRADLDEREAELAALREDGSSPDADSPGSEGSSSSVPWRRAKRWLADRVGDRGRTGGQQTGE